MTRFFIFLKNKKKRSPKIWLQGRNERNTRQENVAFEQHSFPFVTDRFKQIFIDLCRELPALSKYLLIFVILSCLLSPCQCQKSVVIL